MGHLIIWSWTPGHEHYFEQQLHRSLERHIVSDLHIVSWVETLFALRIFGCVGWTNFLCCTYKISRLKCILLWKLKDVLLWPSCEATTLVVTKGKDIPRHCRLHPGWVTNARLKSREVEKNSPSKMMQSSQTREEALMQLRALVTGVDKGFCDL